MFELYELSQALTAKNVMVEASEPNPRLSFAADTPSRLKPRRVPRSKSRAEAISLDEVKNITKDAADDPDGIITLKATVINSAHPWFVESLQRIESLRTLPIEWHDSGAAAPNTIATEAAAMVLSHLSSIEFKPDRIDPSSDEGVCISFRREDRYADIECYNDGCIVALKILHGGKPEVQSLSMAQLNGAIADINGFIFG